MNGWHGVLLTCRLQENNRRERVLFPACAFYYQDNQHKKCFSTGSFVFISEKVSYGHFTGEGVHIKEIGSKRLYSGWTFVVLKPYSSRTSTKLSAAVTIVL